jgi:hypothetical protein
LNLYTRFPKLEAPAPPLISTPSLAIADDLSTAGAMIEVVYLPKALAAIFVFRLNLHSTDRAVVDDERIHIAFPPLRAKCIAEM